MALGFSPLLLLWCLCAFILSALPHACGSLEEATGDDHDNHRAHPSCALGRFLRKQGDLGEAVLALEVCFQNAPSNNALRNLASAYMESGRRQLAHQALSRLLRHAENPTEICLARLALVELGLDTSADEDTCTFLDTELAAAKVVCNPAWALSHDSRLKSMGETLLRLRAEGLLTCPGMRGSKNVLAAATAALRADSLRSWRTLCFALLLQHESVNVSGGNEDAYRNRHGVVEEQRAVNEESTRRCWDSVERLGMGGGGVGRKARHPWDYQLEGAVALMAAGLRCSAGGGDAALSQDDKCAIYEHQALSRVLKAQAYVGNREHVARLLELLPCKVQPAVRDILLPASRALLRLLGAGPGPENGAEVGTDVCVRRLTGSTVRAHFGAAAGLHDSVQVVGINWGLDPSTGWGNYGLQLVHELLASGVYYPILLHPPSARLVRECRRVVRLVSHVPDVRGSLSSARARADAKGGVDDGDDVVDEGKHATGASHLSHYTAQLVMLQGSWAADLINLAQGGAESRCSDTCERGAACKCGGLHSDKVAYPLDFPVIHASKLFFMAENETVWGSRNIAISFFEDPSVLQPHRLERGHKYDAVVLGSSWALRMVEGSIAQWRSSPLGHQYRCVFQGVRANLFGAHAGDAARRTREHQRQKTVAVRQHLTASRLPHSDGAQAPFRIFSGGKLERRKGQDIVLQVFKDFHKRHRDTQLVTAWYNGFVGGMGKRDGGTRIKMASPYCPDPRVGEDGSVDVAAWAQAHGLPHGAVVTVESLLEDVRQAHRSEVRDKSPHHSGDGDGQLHRRNYLQQDVRAPAPAPAPSSHRRPAPLTAGHLRAAMHLCDAGIFLSRAEGGTNLMAMEALASALPLVLSNNTGHQDIASKEWSYPLQIQRPVYADGEAGGRRASSQQSHRVLEGWGESDVAEAVEALERIYLHRDEARLKGLRAAAFIGKEMTWQQAGHQYIRILASLHNDDPEQRRE